MSTRPAFQFYARDWLTCPELRRCSVAARGLWADMLCLAHFGDPYGHLSCAGLPYTEEEIARLTGCSRAEIRRLLAELERNNVFSRAEDGAIVSRRMMRDGEAAALRAAGGAKGAQYGTKGAEHGLKGGRPPKTKAGKKPPSKPPSAARRKPPSEPPPASASASAVNTPKAPLEGGGTGGVLPEQKPKRPRKARIDPATYPLPGALDRPDVRTALVDYLRTRKGGAWDDGLAAVRVAQLVEWGPERAVAALRHCAGYAGLFEPNGRASPAKKPPAAVRAPQTKPQDMTPLERLVWAERRVGAVGESLEAVWKAAGLSLEQLAEAQEEQRKSRQAARKAAQAFRRNGAHRDAEEPVEAREGAA